MVFNKTIIQVYSGKEPFGFHDFVKGTLRLFNYAVDHKMDVKINIAGADFEPYMIVDNYNYDISMITPNVYYMDVDQQNLIRDLDAFSNSSDPIFVVTSNVWLDRNNIYNLSYVGFDKIVRFREAMYSAAEEKVRLNLLYRPNSDNLLYGYSIIYIHRNDINFKLTTRSVVSIANQIRTCLDMNRDIMVFSNSIQLRTILSQYIEMNSGAVQTIDDSDMSISSEEAIPSIDDLIIDYLILLRSKKIYRFSDRRMVTGHNIGFNEKSNLLTNVYNMALDINNIIGNLQITLVPLYYKTYTISGTPPPSISSILNTPSGITIDSSGTLYIADTLNHRICTIDSSGNTITYAGSGIAGYKDGYPSVAQFNSPTAIAADIAGNIYVADTGNNCIRIIQKNKVYDSSRNVITTDRLIGTVIGKGSTLKSADSGNGVLLNGPKGVAVDSSGCIYFSDTGNHRVCKITSGGTMVTLAGCSTLGSPLSYTPGIIDGQGKEASFRLPTGLAVDLIGNVFVADTGNSLIRRITPSGRVSTVAGNGQPFFKEGRRGKAGFASPVGIAVDLHNVLYVTDSSSNMIRRITHDGDVIPVVGSPNQLSGSIDGYGALDPSKALVPITKRATFNHPLAICVDSSRYLYVADTLNNTVRKIIPTFSTPTNIKPVAMQSLRLTNSPGVAYTLGPSLTADPPLPNSLIYGHQRGSGGR